MAFIRLVRTSPHDPAETWRRLTSWEQHAGGVPLTRITVQTGPPNRTGTRFLARTGLGPLGFDDPMELVSWQPPRDGEPGHCRIEKRGRIVTGHAEIAVHPAAGSGSRAQWHEEIRLRGLPAFCDPALAFAGRLLFGRVLDRLLRDRPSS
ncbi:SRPBCC family protein [Streptomyces physcomitrii]|uniref:SRPBCC family protein n=1 Tax=Streptomyces physcomitrii TaxID=2724184 RepID=A0ABX1H848_9ACTN|nr:SRPBCC family protein [Streptomyces physcomitrii]NKI44533.1 SRPBCC family protein [Streptomyces physcomitrii]